MVTMEKKVYSVIVGTGSCVPSRRVLNSEFLDKTFFDGSGERLKKGNQETIDKLAEIRGWTSQDAEARAEDAFFALFDRIPRP